ncbi:hypothetical protein B7463_g1552, partial [Scytalidium lignicola]
MAAMHSADYILDSYLDEIDFVDSESPLDFVDVWNFENDENPIVHLGALPEADVTQWFRKSWPRSTGGLHLLISSRLHDNKTFAKASLGIRRSTFVQLIKILDLPLAYIAAVARQSGLQVRVQAEKSEPNGHPCIIYIIKPPPGAFYFLDCVLSYNPNSNNTYGFLRTNIFGASDFFLRRIQSSTAINHPLFLIAVLSEWQAEMIGANCIRIGSKLVEIEALSGHTAYRDVSPFTNGHRLFAPVKDPNHYRLLTYALTKANYRIAITEVYISSLQDLCKSALNSFKLDLKAVPKERKASMLRDTHLLRQRISCTASVAYHAQLQVQMYGTKVQFQVNVVYNLIAQEESHRNIDIANDSKQIALASQRESLSMRTIAVLGVIFLPGTFTSAFFALPLFNWDASEDENVVKARFWVFWAVTIPLTPVVVGIWWAWMHWSTETQNTQDSSGKNK